ncbi:MAG: Hsp20/alpha crystallin family protein [Candidatus Methanospirareceae archaeon]
MADRIMEIINELLKDESKRLKRWMEIMEEAQKGWESLLRDLADLADLTKALEDIKTLEKEEKEEPLPVRDMSRGAIEEILGCLFPRLYERTLKEVSREKKSLPEEKDRELFMDFFDRGDHYEIIVETPPGTKRENIRLNVTENFLDIETIDKKGLNDRFLFDHPVEPESIEARYNNGVLSVKVKKKK